MITTRNNRLDPSQIPDGDLDQLAKLFAKLGHVALIDDQGKRTHIPEALFAHFARVVRLMTERKAVVLVPEDETFTTQAAANYLGVSRQHFVNLSVNKVNLILNKDDDKFCTTSSDRPFDKFVHSSLQ